MDLTKYMAVTKPLAIDFQGEVINVEYRPNVYTLGFQRHLESLGDDPGQYAEVFLELIAGWDLSYGEEAIPLTVASVEGVPLMILAAIQSAIGDDLLLSEEEKRGSSKHSESQQADSTSTFSDSAKSDPTSSNGSETSESPTASESVPSS